MTVVQERLCEAKSDEGNDDFRIVLLSHRFVNAQRATFGNGHFFKWRARRQGVTVSICEC